MKPKILVVGSSNTDMIVKVSRLQHFLDSHGA
jgi:hypothetical protein